MTPEQEEKLKKIVNPLSVNRCEKEFQANYDSAKKELGIRKEKEIIDQKKLSDLAFKELHPNRKEILSKVLDTSDQQ